MAGTIVTDNARLALAIENVSRKRGLFRDSYRDDIGHRFGAEDIVAVLLLLLCVVVILLMRTQFPMP